MKYSFGLIAVEKECKWDGMNNLFGSVVLSPQLCSGVGYWLVEYLNLLNKAFPRVEFGY